MTIIIGRQRNLWVMLWAFILIECTDAHLRIFSRFRNVFNRATTKKEKTKNTRDSHESVLTHKIANGCCQPVNYIANSFFLRFNFVSFFKKKKDVEKSNFWQAGLTSQLIIISRIQIDDIVKNKKWKSVFCACQFSSAI